MTLANGTEMMASSTPAYKPVTTANLSDLKALVTALESAHPLRVVVMNLPNEMTTADYGAIVPVLWELAERS